MKKDVGVIVVLSVIAVALAVVCIFLITGKAGTEKVKDFEDVHFSISPGRGKTTRYSIVNEGEESKITISVESSARGGSGDSTEKGYCSTEDAIDLMNKYHVLSWDGLDKEGDDNRSFSFTGTINGKEVEGKGKFYEPKDFEDFIDELEDLMDESDDD